MTTCICPWLLASYWQVAGSCFLTWPWFDLGKPGLSWIWSRSLLLAGAKVAQYAGSNLHQKITSQPAYCKFMHDSSGGSKGGGRGFKFNTRLIIFSLSEKFPRTWTLNPPLKNSCPEPPPPPPPPIKEFVGPPLDSRILHCWYIYRLLAVLLLFFGKHLYSGRQMTQHGLAWDKALSLVSRSWPFVGDPDHS